MRGSHPQQQHHDLTHSQGSSIPTSTPWLTQPMSPHSVSSPETALAVQDRQAACRAGVVEKHLDVLLPPSCVRTGFPTQECSTQHNAGSPSPLVTSPERAGEMCPSGQKRVILQCWCVSPLVVI